MNREIARRMLLIWLSAGGCDDGQAAFRQADCRTFCDKLELCDNRTDLEGCERRCAQELIRSDAYMTARARCASQSSCNEWAGEVGLMGEDVCDERNSCQLNDCTSDELARRELSSSEQTYCGRVVSKLNACDHAVATSALEMHCQELVPSLSTAYLEQVQGCIEVDCGQVKTCLAHVSDRFNTNITLYPESRADTDVTASRDAAAPDASAAPVVAWNDAGVALPQ